MNGRKSEKALIGSAQFGWTKNCLIHYEDVEDGAEIGEVIIRYGKNLRKEKIVNLTAKKLG